MSKKILALMISAITIHTNALLAPKLETEIKNFSQNKAEEKLIQVLTQIKEGKLTTALESVEEILKTNPNYKLAQMIKGDLLLARTSPFSNDQTKLLQKLQGLSPKDLNSVIANLSDLRQEAQLRFSRHQNPPPQDQIPNSLIKLSDEVKYAIVIQAETSRIYVFKNDNGKPTLYSDFYVTLGKNGIGKEVEGDAKTPLGVYRIQSYIPGSQLPDIYGNGAYPINYPNPLDKKLGKTGYGIWIHGSPSDTYARAPLASNGCVVLTNDDLQDLDRTIKTKTTPVIISDSFEWVSYQQLKEKQDQIMAQIQKWEYDWNSKNMAAYFSHYDDEFWSGKQKNLNEWKNFKSKALAKETNVKIKDVNIIQDNSSSQKLIVVNYKQELKLNKKTSVSKKTQYWVKRDNDWKILYEDDTQV